MGQNPPWVVQKEMGTSWQGDLDLYIDSFNQSLGRTWEEEKATDTDTGQEQADTSTKEKGTQLGLGWK